MKYESNVDKVKKLIEQKMNLALNTVGSVGDSWIKPLIPVITGNLRANQSYEVNEEQKSIIFYNNTDYAISVHEGSSSNKNPKPFISEGISRNRGKIKKLVSEVMKLD